jgi:tRNA U34 5-methylaminomethyl-2-thiouridine-forming methyltransferase MnmC
MNPWQDEVLAKLKAAGAYRDEYAQNPTLAIVALMTLVDDRAMRQQMESHS